MLLQQNLMRVMIAGAAPIALAGCGASGSGSAGPGAAQTSRPPTPAKAEGQAKAGGSAACQTYYLTVRTAIETYAAVNGADPTSIADLVPDFFLQEPTDWTLASGPDAKAVTELTVRGRQAGCMAPAAGS